MYGFELYRAVYLLLQAVYFLRRAQAAQISPPQGNLIYSSHNRKLFADHDAVSLFQCSQLTSSGYLAFKLVSELSSALPHNC